MFRFKRLTQYDEDYLNQKKNTLENLLQVKSRFEKWCLEYDEEFSNLFNSYNNAKNTDYIGIALKNNHILGRSPEEIINEALLLQRRDLSVLKEKIILEFYRFINTQLKNSTSKYHVLFKNVYESEKEKYYKAKALYKELDSTEFFNKIEDLDRYIMCLKMIYSNFLTNDYSKLNQIR